MSKIIGIVNQKGGVAKTTTANSLAYGLAARGKKVLLVDFDPQGNLTTACRIEVDSSAPPALALLGLSKGLELEIAPLKENLDFIASGIGLETANLILASRLGREQYLKRALNKLKVNYDYVIIDSNPSLSILTMSVLCACDEVVVPFKPEFHSEKGIEQLIVSISEVQGLNENLKIKGFLATLCDNRRKSTKEYIEKVSAMAKEIGSKLFDSVIRLSASIADAPAQGLNVFDYKHGSTLGNADYGAFIAEFMGDEE